IDCGWEWMMRRHAIVDGDGVEARKCGHLDRLEETRLPCASDECAPMKPKQQAVAVRSLSLPWRHEVALYASQRALLDNDPVALPNRGELSHKSSVFSRCRSKSLPFIVANGCRCWAGANLHQLA